MFASIIRILATALASGVTLYFSMRTQRLIAKRNEFPVLIDLLHKIENSLNVFVGPGDEAKLTEFKGLKSELDSRLLKNKYLMNKDLKLKLEELKADLEGLIVQKGSILGKSASDNMVADTNREIGMKHQSVLQKIRVIKNLLSKKM